MKPATAAAIPWQDLRAEYVQSNARSLKAFAEQHDVPYSALCKRARREGWRELRDLRRYRQRVKEQKAHLEFAREVAANAGRYVIRLCTATGLPLRALAEDIQEAARAVEDVWSAALRLLDAQRDLDIAEGRRRVQPVPEWRPLKWERPTKWPGFEVCAYRERGPAGLPKERFPAKTHVGLRAS